MFTPTEGSGNKEEHAYWGPISPHPRYQPREGTDILTPLYYPVFSKGEWEAMAPKFPP